MASEGKKAMRKRPLDTLPTFSYGAFAALLCVFKARRCWLDPLPSLVYLHPPSCWNKLVPAHFGLPLVELCWYYHPGTNRNM
ncbi:unnamed protein product [Eruca vesicaria subsp. sativa]|uniref:Uncharacterized protein n=1 Tax=Eruca vesicaria subsp. sativa TaxID=29727 RepID=A0ABC8JDS7_ERUVS|nr:unnamed protein product [Eruca vesicaria subsp. sativa]